jgi:hypothetical protein
MNAQHAARAIDLASDTPMSATSTELAIEHRDLAHARLAHAAAALMLGVLTGIAAASAYADEPGDIIVSREVTPRIAYRPVPVEDDPVQVRVTTFPKSTFDPLMQNIASDVDLGGARGSAGIAGTTTSAIGAATAALGVGMGAQQRGGVPMGASAQGGTAAIGATVTQTITGALAPLTSGLGTLK